jgi:hypothetical protein
MGRLVLENLSRFESFKPVKPLPLPSTPYYYGKDPTKK